MQILIDNQKTVDVEPVWMTDDIGDPWLILPFLAANSVLEAWAALDQAHRNYRYGADYNDAEPSALFVIESTRSTGAVTVTDVDPHWDGVGTVNGYRMDDLQEATRVLQWGRDLDNDDVPPLPEWAKEKTDA